MSSRWEPEQEFRLWFDVHTVLTRYARGVDRMDWDLVRSAFHADALDDHSFGLRGSPEAFIEAMKKSQVGVEQMSHLNGNLTLLEIDRPGRAVLVESLCIGWMRTAQDKRDLSPTLRSRRLEDKPGPRLGATLNRYLDLLTERDGDFRIARRSVIYEWSSVEISDGQEALEGALRGQRSPHDLSYISLQAYADFADAAPPDLNAT